MDTTSTGSRAHWGSRLSFILAAAGSAIGLGNIWRFPYLTGLYGGAVFVFVYVLASAVIGFTVMLGEMAIGRHTQKNPVGAFQHIKPGTAWKAVGYLGVVTGVGILSYYCVIAGWAVGYMVKMAGGSFRNLGSVADATVVTERIYNSFAANPVESLLCFLAIIAATTLIVSGGIKKGIERWSEILMPILFILVVYLTVQALRLPGARPGLTFYLKPDFSKFSGELVLAALGQALFSLSLGMGTMLTYGSYVKKRENLVTSAAWVTFTDVFIAILAGFIIFPTLFAIPGIEPASGPGLAFKVLPLIFAKIPGGFVFGFLFFLLLIVAALLSTISLLEVPVAYLVDEKKWGRAKAAWLVGGLSFLVGIPSAMSFGGMKIFTKLNVLYWIDLVMGSYSLVIGSLLIALFVGFAWKTRNASAEIREGNPKFRLDKAWSFAIKYLAPVVILVILFFMRGGD